MSVYDKAVLEKQISAVKSKGNMMRQQTAVIQQWPWDNGLPLHRGSMEAFLQESCPENQNPMFREIVLVSVST